MKKSGWLPLAVVFASVYFFSMNGLGALPGLAVNYLLKDKVGLDPSRLAYFQAVTLIAWVIKPLWGMISDLFPIFGSRRRSYLVLTSLFAAACWIILSLLPDLSVAGPLLSLITLIYMAYAFQDVVADGLMVETGQSLNMTGQFQSIQWTAVYVAMIITSFAGGWLAELAQKGTLSYRFIFSLTAVFPLLTAGIVGALAQEQPRVHPEQAARQGLWTAFTHKPVWILGAFLFLWNFSPSFGAPFFYYTVDTLKFTPSFLGALQAVTSIGGLIGSALFGAVFARLPIRKFLGVAVVIGVLATLSYFAYFSHGLIVRPVLLKTFAFVMNFCLGVASAVIFLALLNLAARTSPQFAGGTVFALLMSFYNLGQMGSSALGGYLFGRIGLQPLILISAGFSLLVFFLIPYLPDGHVAQDETAPGGAS